MKRTILIAGALLALITMTLIACGGSQEPAGEAGTPVPTEAEMHVEEEGHSDDEAVAEGLALFRSIGCAGCHGQDGEGDVGPAIAGHTAEQVRRQVRTPQGDVMPAYSQEQLSDEQLDVIIAWVESLGPATGDHAHDHGDEASDEHGQAEAGGEQGHHDEEAGGEQVHAGNAAAHLRLAFFAVKDGNAHDAEHHLEDFVASLEDEHAKAEVEEILASLRAGADMHDVEHELEHLVEEISPEIVGADGPSFHLQLAVDSLTLGDVETAGYHLERYADLVDDADLAAEARELQAHLAEGELHAVEEGIQALLTGQKPDHGH